MFREKLDTLYELYNIRKELPLQVLESKLKLWYHDGHLFDVDLVGMGSENHKRALVTHLIEPFFVKDDSYLFKRHPVNWQPVQIVNSLNSFGYMSDIYGKETDQTLQSGREYDLLFGTNPHFFSFAEELPEEIPYIYYNGGMHWEFQNESVESRLNQLEDRRGTRIKGARKASPDFNLNVADYLIIIGTEYTKKIYQERLMENVPVYNITNAGFDELNMLDSGGEVVKEFPDCQTNFLWLAGSGPVLKGLDLVLEFFAERSELDLYVCGPVAKNNHFEVEYREELYETENIHTLGWVDIFSDEFDKITSICGFHILPSCSESISVAVINSMHKGVIPITTPESGIDIGEFGYQIDSNLESIRDVVESVTMLSEAEINRRSRLAAEQARSKYSKQRFRADLDDAISSIIS